MGNQERLRGLVPGGSIRAASAALAMALALACVVTQPASAQTFTVIHNFTGGADGGYTYSGIAIDNAGNLYGTTPFGGNLGSSNALSCAFYGCGLVYKLERLGSGWVLTPLHSFRGGADGFLPRARVVIGPDGNLYGTTGAGGAGAGCEPYGCGTVFSLRPPGTPCLTSLCNWTETIIYRFANEEGAYPTTGGLTFDQAGNIYGTGDQGSPSCSEGGCGAVYELTPSDGGWTKSVLYSFTGGSDGYGLNSEVILDQAGNVYGVTYSGGPPNFGGTVFQLTPSRTGWTLNTLYAFQRGSDGPS